MTATKRTNRSTRDDDMLNNGSVVVVDQLELFRLGLSTALQSHGFQVVGSTMRAGEGLRVAREHPADFLIVGRQTDLKPQFALREAKRRSSSLKVVFLLEQANANDIARMVSLGADALLLRSAGVTELGQTMQRLLTGERVVAPALAAGTLGRVGPNVEIRIDDAVERSGLSRKEIEVLAELATGATYREMAEALIVTQATVKTHLVHIYAKLGVRNRHEAVARGLALGLLS